MARAHYVKHARKAQKEHGIKKGDPYWWWKFRRGDSKSKEDVEGERVEEKCRELIEEAQGFNWGIS